MLHSLGCSWGGAAGCHRKSLPVSRAGRTSAGAKGSRAPHSLRRYQPDQVPRVVFSIGWKPRVLALGYGLLAIPFTEQPIAHSE